MASLLFCTGKHNATEPNANAQLKKPEWRPDCGPAAFVPAWGATIAGCRRVLIAYNVNLIATKEQAHRIALNVREGGRGPTQPGRLRALQACGWLLAEHNIGISSCSCSCSSLHLTFTQTQRCPLAVI